MQGRGLRGAAGDSCPAPRTAEPGPKGSPGGRPRSLPRLRKSDGASSQAGPGPGRRPSNSRAEAAAGTSPGPGPSERRRAAGTLASLPNKLVQRQPIGPTAALGAAAEGRGRGGLAEDIPVGVDRVSIWSTNAEGSAQLQGRAATAASGLARMDDSAAACTPRSPSAAAAVGDSALLGADSLSPSACTQASPEPGHGSELARALAEPQPLDSNCLGDAALADKLAPVGEAVLADLAAGRRIPPAALCSLVSLVAGQPTTVEEGADLCRWGTLRDAASSVSESVSSGIGNLGMGSVVDAFSIFGSALTAIQSRSNSCGAEQHRARILGCEADGDGADSFLAALAESAGPAGLGGVVGPLCELAQRWEATYLWPAWGQAGTDLLASSILRSSWAQSGRRSDESHARGHAHCGKPVAW